jgi:hypothetical protein
MQGASGRRPGVYGVLVVCSGVGTVLPHRLFVLVTGEVRRASFLGFDGAEVLHVPAHTTAGVLPEPIQQRGEVNGIPGGPPVVIPIRINGGALGVHPPVGVQGQGEEGGGSVASGALMQIATRFCDGEKRSSFLKNSSGDLPALRASLRAAKSCDFGDQETTARCVSCIVGHQEGF